MKRQGFTLILTIMTLAIVLGFFNLFLIVLRNTLDLENLHNKTVIMSNDLNNVYSTVLYELSLIDNYIIDGSIHRKEDYIWNCSGDSYDSSDSSDSKIWSSQLTRQSKSIGGFYLSKITPTLDSIALSGNYIFTFEFLKTILLETKEGEVFLKVHLLCTPINMQCDFSKENNMLSCDDSKSIFYKFNALGEVIDIEKKNN